MEAQLAKWKRRALAFQEGYRDKAFEVTALEIQKMDLLAHGADKVVMRQNESLKTKLIAACIERNEANAAVTALSKAAAKALHYIGLEPVLDDDGIAVCEQLKAALALVSTKPEEGE